MKLIYLIPIIIGAFTIIQGGFNFKAGQLVGVSQAVLVSSFITTLFFIALYIYLKFSANSLPEVFQLKASLTTFKWWFLIPAIGGVVIMLGIPYSMSEVGAVTTTILLVAAQVCTSAIWDKFVLSLPIGNMKILGTLLVIIGVIISNKK